MMEVLEFIFQDVEHILGIAFLLLIIMSGLAEIFDKGRK